MSKQLLNRAVVYMWLKCTLIAIANSEPFALTKVLTYGKHNSVYHPSRRIL